MHSTLTVNSKIKNYSIAFISDLQEVIELIKGSNTITFIDSNVYDLYSELNLPNMVIINCTEDQKSLIGVKEVYSTLIDNKANTKTKLVVIGGGILQDLVGFCASTYCRGLDYILVPTTLLSQVDSCVGGKTSINFQNRKNILGTFYPPSKILIYPNFTKTLSPLDYFSGFGEVYKFSILQNKIKLFDYTSELSQIIYDGLKYKIDVLSRDEFDIGERRYLNFGHTFGHALEVTSNYQIPHGIAVVIGCMIATMTSKKLNYDVQNYELIFKRGIELLKESKITFKLEWFNFDKLIEIIKSDKKSTGKLTMVLIDNKPFLRDIEEYDILSDVLRRVYEII